MNHPLKQRIGGMLLALILLLALPFPAQAQEAPGPVTSPSLADGVLTVGMEANYAPFNWSQTDDANGAVPIANSPGEYANGYDVWMAKKLADGLGVKLEIVKSEWDGLSPALISGKLDAIIAGMSPTPEREKEIDFSDIYYSSDLVMVVQKDSPLAQATSLADFSQARVTGQLNTFHYDALDQIPGVQKETAMDTFPTMITALLAGKIDAYISERPGAMSAVSANPQLTFVSFEEGKGFVTDPSDTAIAVGIAKNDPLKAEVNAVLATISPEERDEAMGRMITYTTAEEGTQGFWSGVASIWQTYYPLFLRGIGVTLLISVLGTAIGFLLGLLVELVRTIPIQPTWSGLHRFLIRLVQVLCTAYVELFRGTPMMVQAMMIFYGSKYLFGIDMNAMGAAFLIVSINTGAYLAETIRGGIEAVDKGQKEAAMALGFSHSQTMMSIVLPQAIQAILPSIGNELVVNVKDTSVLNVISVTELFFVTKGVAGTTYKIFETYFITLVIYLILTLCLTWLLNKLFAPKGRKFSLQSATGSVQGDLTAATYQKQEEANHGRA